MVKLRFFIFFSLVIISFSFSGANSLQVHSQESGPWKTHTYLLYDNISKEAAIIDPGWPVDKLFTKIAAEDLIVKYILITHCHQDHIQGVPMVIKKFPDAKLLYSELEYDSILQYSNWRSLYDKQTVNKYKNNKSIVTLMDFNYRLLKRPDVYIEEGQVYRLGKFSIHVLNTPGHSKGSTSYYTKDKVFSGDLIYYNTIGYIKYKLGSKSMLIQSANKLFKQLADEVIIYPGHGPNSTIGYEKKNNKSLTLKKK